MQVSAKQIAQLLQGEIEGDGDVLVSRPGQIESAQAGEMTFLDNAKYEQFAYTTKASVLLVSKKFVPEQPISATLIRVDNVRESLLMLLQYFSGAEEKKQGKRSPHAFIDASSILDASVSVGHFAVISAGVEVGAGTHISEQVLLGKNVKIGNNCLVYAGVKIYQDTIIGDNCILHSNAVIGADGFGFAPQADKSWKKVPQVGNVVIENDVEVGANTCIDRAALGSTIIRQGAKLDNLIHIAHNVEIGEHTALAAQIGIAGSTHVGAHCLMGGQAGLAGHIKVADGTQVQAQSGIASSIKEQDTAVFGSPAIPYKDFVRAFIIFKQLPAIEKRLRAVEKRKAD